MPFSLADFGDVIKLILMVGSSIGVLYLHNKKLWSKLLAAHEEQRKTERAHHEKVVKHRDDQIAAYEKLLELRDAEISNHNERIRKTLSDASNAMSSLPPALEHLTHKVESEHKKSRRTSVALSERTVLSLDGKPLPFLMQDE